MRENQVTLDHKDTAAFSSDAQLLAELGERLIVKPETALAELLKNSYDADATKAFVWLDEKKGRELHIQDNGHGMTEADFLNYWMKIGTTSKLQRSTSPTYKRAVTGAKGVGRFAVRLLGTQLQLVTTAFDLGTKDYRRLSARFDWNVFTSGAPLNTVEISYEVHRGCSEEDVGTHLVVTGLKDDMDAEALQLVTQEVLEIVNPPIPGVDRTSRIKGRADPGFSLYFGSPNDDTTPAQPAGQEIFERYLSKVTFQVKGLKVHYDLEYRDPGTDKVRRSEEWNVALPGPKNWIGDVQGDIRFLPKRLRMFAGMRTVDGRSPVKFLSDKGGVRIIDRGFRLPPYGDPNDDWLQLSANVAQHTRKWGSTITEKIMPAEGREKEESMDPLLKLPTSRQLLGAIFVESYRPDPETPPDDRSRYLQPAMDRQGLLDNEGYKQLVDVSRAAANFIAIVDVEEISQIHREEVRSQNRETRQSIAKAIKRVRGSKGIPAREKANIIRSFEEIATQVTLSEAAQQDAIRSVESMSLLGILAGFMTHETTSMLRAVNEALESLEGIKQSSKTPDLDEVKNTLRESRQKMRMYIDYTKTFLLQVPERDPKPFAVHPQVEKIRRLFESLTDPRRIMVENQVPETLQSPGVPLGIYSGVLMNLYTNAVKAVLKVDESKRSRLIRFEAEDTEEGQILRVSDTGVGVPPEIKGLVFEPFVSTTKEDEGPLGGGMGLGLYIVKRVLRSADGDISLVSPPEGFTTAFEVLFRHRS